MALVRHIIEIIINVPTFPPVQAHTSALHLNDKLYRYNVQSKENDLIKTKTHQSYLLFKKTNFYKFVTYLILMINFLSEQYLIMEYVLQGIRRIDLHFFILTFLRFNVIR